MSLAGPLALIDSRRLSRLQGAQLIEAQALEHAADGGRLDAGFGGDSPGRSGVGGAGPRCERPWPVVSAGAGDEAVSCGPTGRPNFRFEPIDPFAHRARANAYVFTDGLRRLPTANHVDHALSTERRQAGILMDVHAAPPRTS